MSRDQQKWDARYSAKDRQQPPQTPAFLPSLVAELKPGRLLDVASGDGAAALYLAQAGFSVTALDISPAGLDRLQQFAERCGLAVQTVRADLEHADGLAQLAEPAGFDSILVCRYKPTPALWQQLVERLAPGGVLMLVSFNLLQHQRHGFNARFCLQPQEYLELDDRLELLSYRQLQQDDDYLDLYLFRRRAG
ncbi:class I SAM-dependent methyltransferase [Marinobacterium arenosum]|uniref:class I SAM-dependent methyltransferase n=1 Tax=Marinobacterium arenosum TaxID=2862496 RepID=UPI001C964833|nr:class I SAM-dependent methyltransferase [Marinobacterium arenosum]MBY4677406.1 methyltransferase domain-containing protein [Marinobacterium arenosum]